MLAAVGDLPGTCRGCGEQATARPVRKRARPVFTTAAHCETGSSREGSGKVELMGHADVLAVFGDAPLLGLATTRIQV